MDPRSTLGGVAAGDLANFLLQHGVDLGPRLAVQQEDLAAGPAQPVEPSVACAFCGVLGADQKGRVPRMPVGYQPVVNRRFNVA